jgi:uncharacterized Fe-S cluster-containing radical SAM superfamily protein
MAEKKESGKKSESVKLTPNKSSKRATPRSFRISFKCDKAGGMVTAENVGTRFECPFCKSPLKYEHGPVRLTTTSKIRHEVRKVVELG